MFIKVVVEDTTPYEPIVTEMVLISHKLPDEEDASWYRAVVIDIDEGNYNISMVDFGASVIVKKEDIRKFPENLTDIPMLGIFCELVNIPHEEKVLKKIKELVPESSEVEVHIVALNDIVYSIELPKVYNELKKLELC